MVSDGLFEAHAAIADAADLHAETVAAFDRNHGGE
jgi:hypothetical protein